LRAITLIHLRVTLNFPLPGYFELPDFFTSRFLYIRVTLYIWHKNHLWATYTSR
jgi:hypothetical protein